LLFTLEQFVQIVEFEPKNYLSQYNHKHFALKVAILVISSQPSSVKGAVESLAPWFALRNTSFEGASYPSADQTYPWHSSYASTPCSSLTLEPPSYCCYDQAGSSNLRSVTGLPRCWYAPGCYSAAEPTGSNVIYLARAGLFKSFAFQSMTVDP
jgi:hypothetical protein